MKFLIWNNQAQFVGHSLSLGEAWEETRASFIVQISEQETIMGCWFAHCNEEGRIWYDVPLQQFTLEFFRCRVSAANKSTEAVVAEIESEALIKQIKRWHWKPGKN